MKILCIHGLGDHRNSTWKSTWEEAVTSVFPFELNGQPEFHFETYDDIFEDTRISLTDSAQALWKLTSSGLGALMRKKRGIIGDTSKKIRWTAGYVVAWLEDEKFQRLSRERVLDAIKKIHPDVILAHSLGSLVTYNAITHRDSSELSNTLKKCVLVTFGSQIGNPFVIRNLTNGRIQPLEVRYWRHLFNRHDDVFTAPIRLWDAENFGQTNTPFDIDGPADHAATKYITHQNTVEDLWIPLAEKQLNKKAFGPARIKSRRREKRERRRALLVGINEYPDVADRLEGCVNDVFVVSSVLQECGFKASTIRTCLNKRATTDGILERLEWLLDDPQPGDERVFYFSGHGARIPEYGENHEPDHHLETLVPWDFDWSRELAITDDHIFALYSQLPYNMNLVMIFDCCHSGGIHRDGGAKVRGLTPPDDIRHRDIKWDKQSEMWVGRDFRRLDKGFTNSKRVAENYFGKDGSTAKLGRASMLRATSVSKYNRLKRMSDSGIIGPYLPLIIEACAEREYSYEYRHGVTSYGAFTYSLAKVMRMNRSLSFEELVGKAHQQLHELNYDQAPQVLGPKTVTRAVVPWAETD